MSLWAERKMDFLHWKSRMLAVENKQLFPNCVNIVLYIFHCAAYVPLPVSLIGER